MIRLEFDLALVEAAVEAVISDHPSRSEFYEERERCYGDQSAEQRTLDFDALFRNWFARLGLDESLRRVLDAYPLVRDEVARLGVTRAVGPRDEGAELYVAPQREGQAERLHRHLCLKLRPGIFLEPCRLDAVLYREFEHTNDMLDPAFGYEPELPAASAGPTHDRMLLDRYAALWSTTVSGRLVRRGCAPEGERARAFERFVATFSMLGNDTERAFERLFDGPRPTHRDLVTLAIDPRRGRHSGDGPDPGSRCALCDLPSHAFEPAQGLENATVEALRADFPRWQPTEPICPQCAELYRSRSRQFARSPG
ncbi:MAG: hypothetical protein CL908_12365 [Deltaproteobacteria bacterium]|nr:hypothetical protein [Deltaproteobacteria bacterium]